MSNNFYESQSVFGRKGNLSESKIKRMLDMSFEEYYSSNIFYAPNYNKILRASRIKGNNDYEIGKGLKNAFAISYRWYQNRQPFYRVYPNVIEYVVKTGVLIDMDWKKANLDLYKNIEMPAISFEFMEDEQGQRAYLGGLGRPCALVDLMLQFRFNFFDSETFSRSSSP